jgi:aryl-alcohol dehydrogenase-like predicted oxidoreductase
VEKTKEIDYRLTDHNIYHQITPDLKINKIINGMWQVAGGHGNIDQDLAIKDMIKYHESGLTSWDLADIYGPAEDFVGKFRDIIADLKGEKELEKIQAFTKWVPRPEKITRMLVKENLQRSLYRMKMNSLDLLQFHWWEYNIPYYMDALRYLFELRDEGLVKQIGLTNFDTEHVQIIKDAGFNVLSNQIQFSIIDRRPEVKMIPFCLNNKINIFAYGTLCGGLISEKHLGKLEEPSNYELNTPSLRKYKKMIDIWGGWTLFQELLSALKTIADKYEVSIANIATKYILSKPAVSGVLIGARLGIVDHIKDNSQMYKVNLDKQDYEIIDAVCKKSNNLFDRIGDCGSEYR